ncbi:MAG: hypothetical protein KR126chlam1_00987 [Chlamydiae bacterium]|nr:hypothetical protein [Chlamydiota bacterium]
MKWAFLLTLFLTSCGYYFDGGDKITVSVPYAIGDDEGELTGALANAIARTAHFEYVQRGGEWIVNVKVKGTDHDRIGYRYDRDDKSGKLRDNVIGIENRETISVEVCVESARTGKCILGPQIVKARVDYDYADPNSLRDLSFINDTGKRVTSIAFSLGQLDSVGAAGQEARIPIYEKLARKIVDGMIASGGADGSDCCDCP